MGIPGFALLCDHDGIVRSVIHGDSDEIYCLIDQDFLPMVRAESALTWTEIISSDLDEENFLWKGIVVQIAGRNYTGFAGVDQQKNIIVAGFHENEEMISLYEELIHINSQLTNRVRGLYKEKTRGTLELYDEISKFNNELTNARRILQKQNAELEALNDKLQELAIRDPLTGLYNRRYFFMQTPQIAGRTRRYGGTVCLIMIDINRFKRVNDQLGHHVGDQLLIHLSRCLDEVTRQGQDMAFRFGGDEFLLILDQCDSITADIVIERLRCSFIEAAMGTTLAFGLEVIEPGDIEDDLSNAIRRADEKMYKDKAREKMNPIGMAKH